MIVRESRDCAGEPARGAARCDARADAERRFQIAARDRVCDAFGDLRLRGQRAAALHRRESDRLDAQLSEPPLRHGPDRAGVASAAVRTVQRRRHDRLRHDQRPASARNSPPRKLTFAIALCLICFVLLSVAFRQPHRYAPARADRRGHVRRCGHRGPGGRDGRQPDPCGDSWHGLRDAYAGQQPAGPRARTLRDRRCWPTVWACRRRCRSIPCVSLGAALAFLIGKRSLRARPARVRASCWRRSPSAAEVHVATNRSAAGERAWRRRARVPSRRWTQHRAVQCRGRALRDRR